MFANHDNARGVRLLLSLTEGTAYQEGTPQHAEEIPGHTQPANPFRFTPAGEVEVVPQKSGHGIERMLARAEIDIIRITQVDLIKILEWLKNLYEALRMGVRQRFQQNPIHQAKDRGISTNPQSEDQDGHDGKSRCSDQ